MRSLTIAHARTRFATTVCVLLVGALVTPDAGARCIPFDPITITGGGGQVLLLPDGSGPSLESRGATITVELWKCPGEPNGRVGVPAQDMWLDGDGTGTLAFCALGAIADGPTDENGLTTFSRALAGGGWNTGFVTFCSGSLTAPLTLVSPDINGDLVVEIADFAAFGHDWETRELRSDFNFDGRVDLNDFVIFALAFGSRCP